MPRLVWHNKLERFFELADAQNEKDKYLIKTDLGTFVESLKKFYSDTIKTLKSLQNHLQSEQQNRDRRAAEMKRMAKVIVRRRIKGTKIIVKLTLHERDHLKKGWSVLILHDKKWWIGSLAQRTSLIDHWIDRLHTKKIERRMRRLG